MRACIHAVGAIEDILPGKMTIRSLYVQVSNFNEITIPAAYLAMFGIKDEERVRRAFRSQSRLGQIRRHPSNIDAILLCRDASPGSHACRILLPPSLCCVRNSLPPRISIPSGGMTNCCRQHEIEESKSIIPGTSNVLFHRRCQYMKLQPLLTRYRRRLPEILELDDLLCHSQNS